MKNINIKSFMLLAGVLGLTACSENAWNDKLDGFKEPGVYDKTETVEYTLTADDYKTIANSSTNKSIADAAGETELLKAIGTNGYFPTSEAARKYIPALLSNSSFPYFTLNNGSTIRMTYNIEVGQNEEVVAINNGVKTYTVTEADYQQAWGSEEDFINGFAPLTPASASLPALLKANIADAAAGDYAVVNYAEAGTNPVFGGAGVKEPTVYIEESFTESQGDFTIENVSKPDALGYVWSWAGASYGMKASAFASSTNYASEAWLISPEVTLTAEANAVLTFDQAWNYFTDIATASEEATVNVREKGGNWVKLTVPEVPTKLSWTFVASGDIDLSAYNGKTIQIGFCYKSDAKAGTWELKNLKLMDGGETRSAATRAALAPVPVENKVAIYRFDGSVWKVPGSMLILQPADYTAMGQSYGNLSGTLPEEILPTYLSKTLPYAAEEAAEIVVYKYYNADKKTLFLARQYTLTAGEWVYDSGIEPLTEKFSRKDNVWDFNPSVEMVLPYARNTEPTYTYFMAVKDWVFENVTKKLDPNAQPADGTKPASGLANPAFIDYRNNAEFWSGASAYYGNVDVRASTAKNNAPEGYTGYDGLTDEEISALVLKRFATESFLGAVSNIESDAQMVDGMDVTYTYIFTVFDGSTTEYKVEYLLIDKGKFKFNHLWKSEENNYVEVDLSEE